MLHQRPARSSPNHLKALHQLGSPSRPLARGPAAGVWCGRTAWKPRCSRIVRLRIPVLATLSHQQFVAAPDTASDRIACMPG
ncbi:hypothetical protein GA0115261_106608 [Streptomyces sp. OspMP-M43]|nr:hypothetical protein GA0115261_106608 [Streptomyces sp. OspMP-M43]